MSTLKRKGQPPISRYPVFLGEKEQSQCFPPISRYPVSLREKEQRKRSLYFGTDSRHGFLVLKFRIITHSLEGTTFLCGKVLPQKWWKMLKFSLTDKLLPCLKIDFCRVCESLVQQRAISSVSVEYSFKQAHDVETTSNQRWFNVFQHAHNIETRSIQRLMWKQRRFSVDSTFSGMQITIKQCRVNADSTSSSR